MDDDDGDYSVVQKYLKTRNGPIGHHQQQHGQQRFGGQGQRQQKSWHEVPQREEPFDAGVALLPTPIARLQNFQNNITLVGVVLAAQDPKSFPDKKTQGRDRWTVSFTLRDSYDDTVNISCWGSEEWVKSLVEMCTTGFIGTFAGGRVQNKNPQGARWLPPTTMDVEVSYSEHSSNIKAHDESEDLERLRRAPLPQADITSISALQTLPVGQQIDLNLLCAVSEVGAPRTFVSKSTGRPGSLCHATVFDASSSSAISLTLWGDKRVAEAQTWAPSSVILLINVHVNTSGARGLDVSVDQKSIVILDPDFPDAAELGHHAMVQTKLPTAPRYRSEQSHVAAAGPAQLVTIDEMFDQLAQTGDTGTFAVFAELIDLRFYPPVEPSGEQQDQQPKSEVLFQCDISDHTASLGDLKIRNADTNLEPLLQVPPRDVVTLSEQDWRALKMNCLFQPLKFILQASSRSCFVVSVEQPNEQELVAKLMHSSRT
eukprot:m.148998 g.148998  ORF g.148998 m.148998 type:complete len:485 (+) comp15065_c0_seq1:161-1615(+)